MPETTNKSGYNFLRLVNLSGEASNLKGILKVNPISDN